MGVPDQYSIDDVINNIENKAQNMMDNSSVLPLC